jgi:hypothetical protein
VTEQITRPATLEDLKTLLRSLNANSVDYLLIGGYALAAHGYQRATTDIDSQTLDLDGIPVHLSERSISKGCCSRSKQCEVKTHQTES